MNHLFMTLYEQCNNAYIQLIAFDPQLLITAMYVKLLST